MLWLKQWWSRAGGQMRIHHVHQGLLFMTSFDWISLNEIEVEQGFAWFMRLCPRRWLLSLTASTESRLVKKLSCSRRYVTRESVGILMESWPHANVCVWGIDSMTHARFSGRLHGRVPSRFGFRDCLSERRQKLFRKLWVGKRKKTDPSELKVVRSVKCDLDGIELKPFRCKRFGWIKPCLFLFYLIALVLNRQHPSEPFY